MGPTPRYQKAVCFDPFPFPEKNNGQHERIQKSAEQLDRHRKQQLAQHAKLTMTGMYNVLEKLRAEEPLNEKEQVIHEQGLVSILRQLHDYLDAAVFDAYGWPHDLSDEQILEKLVALNAERAAEEARGLIRWLRPEYQAPDAAPTQQTLVAVDSQDAAPIVPAEKQLWPTALPAQAQAVRGVLGSIGAASTVRDVAAAFKGKATKKRLTDLQSLLDTLVALGQATLTNDRYSA